MLLCLICLLTVAFLGGVLAAILVAIANIIVAEG
jgi:hypothetical protein